MLTTIVIYYLLAVALIVSLIKSREKTLMAVKVALRVLKNSAISLIVILALVGLTLGVLSPQTISKILGKEAGIWGTLLATLIGAVTLIPSLIAFPLAGSLYRSGSTVATIAAFITSLTLVGLVTAPMEIKYLGKRFTLLRNLLSLFVALLLALIMGVIV